MHSWPHEVRSGGTAAKLGILRREPRAALLTAARPPARPPAARPFAAAQVSGGVLGDLPPSLAACSVKRGSKSAPLAGVAHGPYMWGT